MLRRLLFFLALTCTFTLTTCSGGSLDYYLVRLAVKLNMPMLDRRQPVPIPSPTPAPTKWINLTTPTPTPPAVPSLHQTLPATPQSRQPGPLGSGPVVARINQISANSSSSNPYHP